MELIIEFLRLTGFSFDSYDFETIIVIQVDMLSRDNKAVITVLNMGNAVH